MGTETEPVLQCKALYKSYRQGPQKLAVLRGVTMTVEAGEEVAIVGTSGSGKSTLFHLLGGLDRPTAGEVLVAGRPLSTMTEAQLGQLRNRYLGFVYQFHYLLGEFSTLENVAMPLLIRGDDKKSIITRATQLLEQVGLAHRLHHKPAELSGGERQRVAIARALVGEPCCVLLDEPTGNLDRHTATAVYQLIQKLNRELNTSFIIVTHDDRLAAQMDRILCLDEGVISEAARY